jgi:hypothetical protein
VTDRDPRIIPGIFDSEGKPLPMPYDEEGWRRWYVGVLGHRVRVENATKGDDPQSLGQRAVQWRLCAQPGANGLLYFLNTFGFILEPRNADNPATTHLVRLPWITWPRQADLADHYEATMLASRADPDTAYRSNTAIVKDRDVGATWFDAAHNAKEWNFAPYWDALVISTNFDLAADDQSPKSYMFKVQYVLKNMPEWLLPVGISGFGMRKEHDKEANLINPVTGSHLTASTTTPEAGRGDRKTKLTIEEAGTHDDFGALVDNAVLVANHVFSIGTPNVDHGYDWHNYVHGKEGFHKPEIFIFRWYEVPGRDHIWYRATASVMSEERIQRELNQNWLIGTGEFLYAPFLEKTPGYFPFVHGWPTRCVMDDGLDDHFAITIFQKDLEKRRVRCIAGYYNNGKVLRYYGQLLTGKLTGQFYWGERERAFADWLREYFVLGDAIFYGDRHGDNRELIDGRSPFQVLGEEFGIYVITAKDPARNELKFRRDALNTLAPIMDFDEQHGAPEVLDALKFSRLPNSRSSSQRISEHTDAPHIQKPSHYAATCQYYAINESDDWFDPGVRLSGPAPRSTVSGFSPRAPSPGRRFQGSREPRTFEVVDAPDGMPAGWDSPWIR